MKILILSSAKIKYMPYVNFCINNLDLSKHDVHFVYWNKDLCEEEIPYKNIALHELRLKHDDDMPKPLKIFNFIKYRKFVLSILNKTDFDLIVIYYVLPAFLIFDKLHSKYKDKYIIDYRDITFERFNFYKKAVHRVISGAKATFISSDAFREFLPDTGKIYTTHNILPETITQTRNFYKNNNLPLKISTWGFFRDTFVNRAFTKSINNDSRFTMFFHGDPKTAGKKLQEYCAEIDSKNISFSGRYNPSDKCKFGYDTDLLYNMFDNDKTKYALSNRFYDGIVFSIPQLCTKDSFMGEMVEKYGIGKQFDPKSPDFANEIYDYYMSLDTDEFNANCKKTLEKVLYEYNEAADFYRNL